MVETKRSGAVTAYVSARVTGISSNGNLMIAGFREVTVNNEQQVITLTGVVRPKDITPDNVVLSTYVADARIVYSGTGVINDKQRPGWLARTPGPGLAVLGDAVRMSFKNIRLRPAAAWMKWCFAALVLIFLAALPAQAVRIKDIADLRGVRQNQLVGYGLVVGLDGTGDKDAAMTVQSLSSMLEKMGMTVDPKGHRGR